ncbi:Ulp1 protease family carboxy-terminal domain protein [Trifolium medium]|uniref:Ulp1 protease family carboxy-terminal domain protein n=1 Tax=Trifolium medium TaxID=97028 RepID=A0A392P840_9FABA|nr:Ulp1 protease family carboxy-terminal domain protein [Trifolium medium]
MDVARDSNVTELELKYGTQWMPTVPDLKLICVPIEDVEHIFLMVIKMDEMKVYHLDTHLLSHQVGARRLIIKKICDMVSQISLSLYDLEVPSCAFPHFDT